MAPLLEELDFQETPLGELVLRRRRSPAVADELVYEVTLDHEMLMSSSVNASERALAALALEGRPGRRDDVLVGGLGLGYTAGAVLEYPDVRRLVVVELLDAVIGWHRRRLVPMADALLDDGRCALVAGDFFAHVGPVADPDRYDAILLDIDHAPDCRLDAGPGDFYSPAGLRAMARCLRPGGVFALWSAWQPGEAFMEAIRGVFGSVRSCEVPFFNPHVNERDANWVIVAEAAPDVPQGR